MLQPIGAGFGLAIATPATEAARVATIVHQREHWGHEAITAFGWGDIEAAALASYAVHQPAGRPEAAETLRMLIERIVLTRGPATGQRYGAGEARSSL